jgi:hypothetical protein
MPLQLGFSETNPGMIFPRAHAMQDSGMHSPSKIPVQGTFDTATASMRLTPDSLERVGIPGYFYHDNNLHNNICILCRKGFA